MPQDGFRLAIIGLDSVSPDLLYRRFAREMPRLGRLLSESARGTLKSCDPPITVPAWAVMFSGVDPGTLGLYGFRHRVPGSYDRMYTPLSSTARQPMVWDRLSRSGYRVAVLGMPPGYPPPHVNGMAISDFLTPESATDYVYPDRLRSEVDRVAGGRFFDIPFRVEDRRQVAQALSDMTRRRWKLARHFWHQEKWDLFAVHEIGPDRLHHAFWKYFDDQHPRYEAGSAFAEVASDYYRLLDEEVGEFLDGVGPDVAVLVASDHGSQAMQGCFGINEWLIREGYLVLSGAAPPPGTPLELASVDWARTRVWGAGGYYARLFFNVRGRETAGTLLPSELPALTEELRGKLSGLRAPNGSPLPVRLFAPSDVYRRVEGDPPDLMAYFGETSWRAAGSVGHPGPYLEENDIGPDDAVHSFDGVIAWREPNSPQGRALPVQHLLDIGPTILRRFGVPIPPEVQGRPIPELSAPHAPERPRRA